MNSIEELLVIMEKLRDPKGGCPWDLEQTLSSIIPHTIEEAYEVADAVEQDDMPALCDELGDLLLQVVFLSQIAKEEGSFTFSDVVDSITTKLVRRHPHVFSDGTAIIHTSDEQTESWEKIKQQEREGKQQHTSQSILDDVPKALPALLRASKLQKRVSRVGFDWPDTEGVFNKCEEEIYELRQAVDSKDPDAIKDELGDVLFTLVNYANHMKVNPEEALTSTNKKFKRRFNYIEEQLKDKDLDFEDVSLEEMDKLWHQAKKSYKDNK